MIHYSMRAIIQRVSSARVSVKNNTVGQINSGYFILLGITHSDTEKIATSLANKISKIRLMADSDGKMNIDLRSSNAECLVVSQFTLYSETKEGNRPSFTSAAGAQLAKPLYEIFIKILKDTGIKVETGEFGSYMDIETKLDGPVTIILDESI